MEVNAIVALLRSHQFDSAKKMLAQVSKHNKHFALKGIGAFFLLKDKKFDEALKLVQNCEDSHSVFLKSHILLAQKQTQAAFENLISHVTSTDSQLIQNEGYLLFLLNTAIAQKLSFQTVEPLVKLISTP